MNKLAIILIFTLFHLLISCSGGTRQEKGFQVSSGSGNNENNEIDGLNRDSLKFETRPGSVLLTGVPRVRLTTIYKVNVNEKKKTTFIGSNSFYYSYERNYGGNWNNNLMPGIKAVYGYNMVNVSHYDIEENVQKNFFEKPVLIKTLYYPTFSKDTLNGQAVNREYFMVSVYNDDTNKDGFINLKDLRRLYLFNLNGEKQNALVPENYSVLKSEYDPENDLMYVFAQLDSNGDGTRNDNEPIHIFWIDLKDPSRTGRQY